MYDTIKSNHTIVEGQWYNCGKWFKNSLPLDGHEQTIECDCGFGNTTHELTKTADNRHLLFP